MNKKITKIFTLMAIFGCVAISFTSCTKKDPNSPGFEYMPDMYRSPSLETNLVEVIENEDGTTDTVMSNRYPVKGTISRGNMPYTYANSYDGYEAAGKELTNPLEISEVNLAEGKRLFIRYCSPCHGKTGEADGKVADKLPGPPPAFNRRLKDLVEGKIFHSITYGKGMMGSHSGQLSQEERWKVTMYVQKLQGN